jgi:hypothetical protein
MEFIRSWFSIDISLPPKCRRVGSCVALLEDCSTFTGVTAFMLAKVAEGDPLHRSFSSFIAFITALIPTGWS